MATTTLNVDLSATLQNTLSATTNGGTINARLFFYQANLTSPITKTLIDGSVIKDASPSIDLPNGAGADGTDGGKLYIVVQSLNSGSATKSILDSDFGLNESEISFTGATGAPNLSYRFDSFEVSLLNSSGDAANLTSVNGFGFPIEVSIPAVGETRGYGVSGSSVFENITAETGKDNILETFAEGPLVGTNSTAISPTTSVGITDSTQDGFGVFANSDWDDYITSLQAESGVSIAGFYNGAKTADGIYHNPGFYSYELEYDASDDAFWLNPTDGSEIKGHIKFTKDATAEVTVDGVPETQSLSLDDSIYSTLGAVQIFENRTDSDAFLAINTGENSQWGAVLARFFTGFTGGYYGNEGKPLNSALSGTIDLDENWNWDPSYAFGKNLANTPPTTQYFDPYSESFFFNSNSYGSNYSDSLMQSYSVGGPLMSTWDSTTNANVDTINLTIRDDSEAPSPSGEYGYVTPEIYTVIDAPEAGYSTSYTDTANSITFTIANLNTVLDKDVAKVTFSRFDGSAGGEPTFTGVQDVTLDSSGSFTVTNVPVVSDGISWYQLAVSNQSGGNAKTFNIYAETSGTEFKNPDSSTYDGTIAVDGLGTFATPVQQDGTAEPTIETFTVNLMYSTTTTVDPDLLTGKTGTDYGSTPGVPFAPVVGALEGGTTFSAAAGAEQGNADYTLSGDVSGSLAFAWTGESNTTNTAGWISGPTNKISAGNTALVSVQAGDGTGAVTAFQATADLDGRWSTDQKALGNGQYTASVVQKDTSGTALGTTSTVVTFTVQHDALTLETTAAGNALAFADDAADTLAPQALVAASGGWIRLDSLDSDVASGSRVVAYAVDETGARVSRDGTTTGDAVSVDDATLATIGSGSDDNGITLHTGGHSVFLVDGQELRFATIAADGTVAESPTVAILDRGDGAFNVNVGDFRLTAAADNALDSDEMLAQAQRDTNLPLVYVEQGSTLSVDIAGDSANRNTLAFVRVAVDPETGALSVEGVEHASTDAYEAAVLANLDSGFSFTGVGDIDTTETWTVSGESGFYAPVLITQTGETLVVGTANANGQEQIRLLGENAFGIEDLLTNSDADFSDLVVQLSLI